MRPFIITTAILLLLVTTALPQRVVEFDIKVDEERFQPDKITVKKGDRVILRVTSIDDKDHGLTLKDFGLKRVIIPAGKTVNIEFTADKGGTFLYRCSKYCSARHLLFIQPRLTIEVKP